MLEPKRNADEPAPWDDDSPEDDAAEHPTEDDTDLLGDITSLAVDDSGDHLCGDPVELDSPQPLKKKRGTRLTSDHTSKSYLEHRREHCPAIVPTDEEKELLDELEDEKQQKADAIKAEQQAKKEAQTKRGKERREAKRAQQEEELIRAGVGGDELRKLVAYKPPLDLTCEEDEVTTVTAFEPSLIGTATTPNDLKEDEAMHYAALLSRLRASWKYATSVDDVCKLAITTDKILDSRHTTIRGRSRNANSGGGGKNSGFLTPFDD